MIKTKIRILPKNLINQIAAGEVVERPASVVKEIVENSIDAGADIIDIQVKDGGKTYISVSDNGSGMTKEELELSVQRHATSKLGADNLLDIHSFGFRGEALPSIASIAKLKIIAGDGKEGWEIKVEGGEIDKLKPARASKGTKVEIRDLFFATPARLKFLKTERSELSFIMDTVQRLVLSNPGISFSLNGNIKYVVDKKADKEVQLLEKISNVLGKDFSKHSIRVDVKKGDVHLYGYIAKPTYNKANTLSQYLFVNGRPVKDKLLGASVRAAYQDTLEKGRYPAVVLFLDLPFDKVDVNVHPAKAEVRFREAGFIRGFVVSALKNIIAFSMPTPSVVNIDDILRKKDDTPFDGTAATPFKSRGFVSDNVDFQFPVDFNGGEGSNLNFLNEKGFILSGKNIYKDCENLGNDDHLYPLGVARGQIHSSYIISQTRDGIVIVDQHACHERIVYEKLKKEIDIDGVKRQILLIPEVVELDEKQSLKLLDLEKDLERFGLVIEAFGKKAVIVRETPAILGDLDIQGLIKDLADEVEEVETATSVLDKLSYVVKTYACHTSVRAGQSLSMEEMNGLLREVEQTENAGQCNHGRPAYVKLYLSDIEKLFNRK